MQEFIKTHTVSRMGKMAKAGAQVGLNMLFQKIFSANYDHTPNARTIKEALGELKGPMMKIAQMLGTIPGAVPREFQEAFRELQGEAPSMGPLFVKRRMRQELTDMYNDVFELFDVHAFKAASLGQIHKAVLKENKAQVVCKLQYPDMETAIATDIQQFKHLARILKNYGQSLDAQDLVCEVEERLWEEINYEQEAQHIDVFRKIYDTLPSNEISAPILPTVYKRHSTKKLLVMSYLEGISLNQLSITKDQANALGKKLFWYWYYPLYFAGCIHADSHGGNYSLNKDFQVNIFDFGCIKVFSPEFVQSIIDLYRGLLNNNRDQYVHAFERWGFSPLNKDTIESIYEWASYIYAPLLNNRVQLLEESCSSDVGRKLAWKILQNLTKSGGLKLPRDFVFLDRATIGIGGTLMSLRSECNWHQEFEKLIASAQPQAIHMRQKTLGISI